MKLSLVLVAIGAFVVPLALVRLTFDSFPVLEGAFRQRVIFESKEIVAFLSLDIVLDGIRNGCVAST